MANEVRSMETLSAAVREIDSKYFIVIEVGTEEVRIPLSDNKPTQVKKAFNRLILRIKEGPFELRLNEVGDDLFSHVAKEYMKQLNREVREVRAEMVQHGLVEE